MFFFASRRRHTRFPLLTGCPSGALPTLVLRLVYGNNDPIQRTRIPPGSIFVTTFTERAAKNLEDRVGRYRDKLVQIDPSFAGIDLAKLRIGTLHSLANDILQEHRSSNYRNVDRKSTRLNSSH